jgi:hypothetical protein
MVGILMVGGILMQALSAYLLVLGLIYGGVAFDLMPFHMTFLSLGAAMVVIALPPRKPKQVAPEGRPA